MFPAKRRKILKLWKIWRFHPAKQEGFQNYLKYANLVPLIGEQIRNDEIFLNCPTKPQYAEANFL